MAMSDQIRLTHGSLPWKPSDDAVIVSVFDEYDIPTQGILSQQGCLYLFECLMGRMTRPGIWMYTHIQGPEFAELEKAEGDAFDQLVLQIQAVHPAKLAVSVRGEGLVAEIDVWDVQGGMRQGLVDLDTAFQEWVEHLVRSKAEFGGLESDRWERVS